MAAVPPPTWSQYPGYAPPGVAYQAFPAYAGFWARLAAVLIDGLVTLTFYIPAVIVMGLAIAADDPDTTDFDGGALLLLLSALALFLLAAVGVAVYHSLMVASRGATIGKRALGIRIVDLATGRPPTKGMALGRYAFNIFISMQFCYLGNLWMLWDDQRQTWHDKVCRTVVVRD